MKLISKFTKIIPMLLLVITISACSSDDDNGTPQGMDPSNIVELAIATPQLSTLVAAVTQAGLVDTLISDGPFTVLAPTNDAFDAFLSNNGFSSLADVPNDLLREVLLNHVITGNVSSTTLINAGSGYSSTNATGPDNAFLSIYFDTSNGVVFNGISEVTDGGNDIPASNGTVHIVDTVIGLPTMVDFALANPALSILVDALAYADDQDPSPMLIPTLSGDGPFTVFAPTNDAFGDLLVELGVTALTDIDRATVEAVLRAHVLADNVRSSELTTTTVQSINMVDLDIDATEFTITDPNDRVSNLVLSLVDIQGINGVVHVIDKVIRPLAE